ncbi:MAG: WG repeat-containing protein, partial [Saprospiraceae bacterium]|nr:WG repeat-containing protein [Saprospiraceae bacterium]
HKAYQYVLTDSSGDLVLDSSVHVSVNFNDLYKLDRLVIFKVDENNKHYYGLVANDGQLIKAIGETAFDRITYRKGTDQIISVWNEQQKKYAFLNQDFDFITPFKYTNWQYHPTQLSMVWIGDKYGFMDEEGKEIIPVQFEAIKGKKFNHLFRPKGFIGNYASVSKNGKWGLIDSLGREIIPFDYDQPLGIGLFSNDKSSALWDYFYTQKLIVRKNRKVNVYGLIDSNNQVLLKEAYVYIQPFLLGDKQYILGQKFKGKKELFDLQGNKILNHSYQDLSASKTGLLIASKGKGKYGLINLEGKELIPLKYYWIQDLDPKHGLFLFRTKAKGSLQGIINQNGEVILKPTYEYISHFQEGLAVVGRRNQALEKKQQNIKRIWEYGFINLEGELVIPFQYSNVVYHFKNGEATVVSPEKGKITIQKPE